MSYVKIDKETWRQCALYIFMNVKFIDCLNLTEHGVWKSLEMSHLHSINLELGCLRGQRPTFCLVILLQKKLEIESQNNSLFREVWQQKKKGRKKPLGPRKKSCSSQNRQDTTTVGAKACGAEHREKTKDTKVNLCWRKLEKLPGGVSRRHSPLSAKSRTERARLHRALHGVYSFITCVFGIVLRSADYSRCTETRPRYFLRVSEFFSDSDKILAAASTAALGALEAEPGKPANVEWDPEEVTSSSTFGIWTIQSLCFSVFIQILKNHRVNNLPSFCFKFLNQRLIDCQSRIAP